MQGFKHGCDCTDKKHYYLVTEDVREDPEATNTQSGCSFFRRNMLIHLYTQYQDLCEEFYGGKTMSVIIDNLAFLNAPWNTINKHSIKDNKIYIYDNASLTP